MYFMIQNLKGKKRYIVKISPPLHSPATWFSFLEVIDMGFLCVIPSGIFCILSNSTYMFFSHYHLFIYTSPAIYGIFFFFF